MTFTDYTLDDFIEKLASKSATPGGGSIAGLSDALGASLLLMVIRLTKTDILDEYISDLDDMKSKALKLIDEDAESFDKVMAAFKLPKDTKDEQQERKAQIQTALKGASMTPLETMKLGLRILELAPKVIKNGNPNALSDVGVASLMTLSAIKSARYNVLINVNSLEDNKVAKDLTDKANKILNKAEKLAQEVESITEEQLLN